jgi:hypothetical protein
MKKLPVYKMVIKPEDESGVDFIAMVDDPAIEEHGMWQKFESQNIEYKFQGDSERQIISGYAMVADKPIYRRDDANGEYYVVFDKSTIEQIVKKFAEKNYFNNVNFMHDKNQKAKGVFMIESFMVDSERGIQSPKGYPKAPDGSWFVSYYVKDKATWDRVKSEEFKGISVEGMFSYVYQKDESVKKLESFCQDLIDCINQL